MTEPPINYTFPPINLIVLGPKWTQDELLLMWLEYSNQFLFNEAWLSRGAPTTEEP